MIDMTAFNKAWRVVKIQDAGGRTKCVHCDRAYADMEVKPEPGESWADGCPWCYADIAEEEDRRSRPNPSVVVDEEGKWLSFLDKILGPSEPCPKCKEDVATTELDEFGGMCEDCGVSE
jgi:hypothetical protein